MPMSCRGRGWHGGSRPRAAYGGGGIGLLGGGGGRAAAGRGAAGEAHGGRLGSDDAAARRRPLRRRLRPRAPATAAAARLPRRLHRGGPGRAPGPPDPGRAARLGARGGGRAPGGAAQRGAARRPVGRPGAPGARCCWRTAARSPGRLRDHDRRERRHAPDAARPVGAPSRPTAVRAAAHGGLPRWSSAPAPTWARSSRSTSRCAGWPGGSRRQLAAAQTIGVGRAGRPYGLAGRPARPGVRGEPARAVRPRQLPPVGRGLRDGRDGRAADAVRGAGPVAGGRSARTPARREGILPVAQAAAEAASEGGTEVTRRPRAPWALLKHRRRRRLPAPGADRSPESSRSRR